MRTTTGFHCVEDHVVTLRELDKNLCPTIRLGMNRADELEGPVSMTINKREPLNRMREHVGNLALG